jgi:hypothetical protein
MKVVVPAECTEPVGVLRLRECFALRSGCYAQDDNSVGITARYGLSDFSQSGSGDGIKSYSVDCLPFK